jgi:hypothetical protein
MTGEIAILVALVIYSVPPERVDGALRYCLRKQYQPHGLPHGHGCKFNDLASTRTVANCNEGLDQRGLVVSVWHELDGGQGTSARPNPTALTAAQKITLFEGGGYPGYGKFVN